MKINDKNCVTVDEVKKHFKHPVFWKIDDGDEATIKFYKNNGILVARIRFANGIRHYFAIFEADSQADADERNREFNRMSRKEARDEEKQRKHEISYEVMRERGFDVAQSRRKSDPAEIVAYNGEPDRLLGYEVHTSPFCPVGAIAFGDYKYYNIGDRGTRSFSELRELFAGNGMIAYLAKERVDGKLILPEAVQILKVEETTTASN